ncbi:MAG: response regulator transcription factor [Armatimonadaceae bacterium]
MPSKVSVLIADDHLVVRQGLRALIESTPEFDVVGEASDGITAVEMVERLTPKVLLTDLLMPGLTGLEVLRQVSQRSPGTHCLAFSMHASEMYISEAFRNGALGYILKGAEAPEILQALYAVSRGERYVSPGVSNRIVDAYLSRVDQFAVQDPYDELTNREREILKLVAEGATNAEIAEVLSISPRTVEIHRSHVMRKMKFRTHSALVRFAIRKGLISLDEPD